MRECSPGKDRPTDWGDGDRWPEGQEDRLWEHVGQKVGEEQNETRTWNLSWPLQGPEQESDGQIRLNYLVSDYTPLLELPCLIHKHCSKGPGHIAQVETKKSLQ